MEITTFKSLNLPKKIFKAIEDLGFENATEIQAKSIPLIREGNDIIGKSQTGTGKTMAFAIPTIEAIDQDMKKGQVQTLIICPTRELALQASDEIKKLCKYTENIATAEIYGGVDMQRQIYKLRHANVVIGTPGRLMDHLRRRTLKIDNLKSVILDEADEMLSMGFKEDIETILESAPTERQTILFSATMPPAILEITKQFQNNPVLVTVANKQATLENIRQGYYSIPSGYKQTALNVLLQFYNVKRTIIFANTKKMVDEISLALHEKGFNSEGLHGDMKQMQRTKVMNDFKAGKINALIATDVAARGIDVNDVELVINFDIPQNTEYYVHRIGRTGRAGKSGDAITMCCGNRQLRDFTQLCRVLKLKVEELQLPNKESLAKNTTQRQVLEVETFIQNVTDDYNVVVDTLKANGHDDTAIIKALLQMYYGKVKNDIEEIPVVKKRTKTKSVEQYDGTFEKIKINIGKNKRVAPKHLVASIAENSCLHGKDLGKIEIFEEYCIVNIPSAVLKQVLSDLKDFTVNGKNVKASHVKGGGQAKRKPSGGGRKSSSSGSSSNRSKQGKPRRNKK